MILFSVKFLKSKSSSSFLARMLAQEPAAWLEMNIVIWLFKDLRLNMEKIHVKDHIEHLSLAAWKAIFSYSLLHNMKNILSCEHSLWKFLRIIFRSIYDGTSWPNQISICVIKTTQWRKRQNKSKIEANKNKNLKHPEKMFWQ